MIFFKYFKHNLNILEDGQGGLLEVLYFKEQVFVSYSENLKKGSKNLTMWFSKTYSTT